MTIIEVIVPQNPTLITTTDFRSVPQGITLTASGNGSSYLSNDGTYKVISGGGGGGSGDMTKAVYDPNDDGLIAYSILSGVPSTFTPSAHTHPISAVTGLQAALDSKLESGSFATVASTGLYSDLISPPTLGTASSLNVPVGTTAASGEVVKGNDVRLSDSRTPLTHTHVISETTGLQAALDAKQPLATILTNTTASFTSSLETKLSGIAAGAEVNVNADWNSVTGDSQILNKPSTFTPSIHAHAIADVTGLQTAIDAKQPSLTGTGFVKSTTGTISYDNNSYYLASNPAGYTTNTGTVTTASVVSANGFSGSVATATTTPAITLTLQNATTAQSGQLTSTDWNTFNSKQAALVSGTNIKSVNGNSLLGSGDVVINTTGTTNLSVANITTTALDVVSDTGTDATIPSATVSLAGLQSSADKTKLNGIATGATANSSDATLLARANHTGTQLASTISDFSTAADARITNAVGTTVQAYDGDLAAIAALSTNGFAKRTGVNTWAIDGNTYLTGNQTITISGEASGSGTTAITLTLANNIVTNAKLAQVATATFKGRLTAATGNVEDLTGAQATSLLDVFTTSTKGLVGASGGGTSNFLRADGTWSAPAGGSSVNTALAQIDFGAGLHTSEVNLVVTGQTGISSTSVVRCNLEPVATSNHTVEDHRYAATFIAVTADTIVNGTGFTIRARTLYPMTGIFTVRWTWQ